MCWICNNSLVIRRTSIFDLFGKLTPITAGMRVVVRNAVMETENWDDVVSSETRYEWVKNLWRLFRLQGIQFSRAQMPGDAVNREMRLICAVDAASQLKIIGVWAGFLQKNGEYSCQLLIGRSLLVREAQGGVGGPHHWVQLAVDLQASPGRLGESVLVCLIVTFLSVG